MSEEEKYVQDEMNKKVRKIKSRHDAQEEEQGVIFVTHEINFVFVCLLLWG